MDRGKEGGKIGGTKKVYQKYIYHWKNSSEAERASKTHRIKTVHIWLACHLIVPQAGKAAPIYPPLANNHLAGETK